MVQATGMKPTPHGPADGACSSAGRLQDNPPALGGARRKGHRQKGQRYRGDGGRERMFQTHGNKLPWSGATDPADSVAERGEVGLGS